MAVRGGRTAAKLASATTRMKRKKGSRDKLAVQASRGEKGPRCGILGGACISGWEMHPSKVACLARLCSQVARLRRHRAASAEGLTSSRWAQDHRFSNDGRLIAAAGDPSTGGRVRRITRRTNQSAGPMAMPRWFSRRDTYPPRRLVLKTARPSPRPFLSFHLGIWAVADRGKEGKTGEADARLAGRRLLASLG